MPADFDPDVPSREAILDALRTIKHHVTPAELANYMELKTVSTLAGFEKRLSAMERDGQFLLNKNGTIALVDRSNFIAGKVQGHRNGFGFLIREDGGKDFFLAPREMLKVLHGDRVLVKPIGDYRGKPDATIVEVLERHTKQLVGRLLQENGGSIVVPEDQRIKHDIFIADKDLAQAQHGQVVMVTIIEQPSRNKQTWGRITDVLGEIDDPGMEVEIAVRKFDVPVKFSKAALMQAENLPALVEPADLENRIDLRDIPFITIDGEDARDFDDAVYCEPIKIGDGSRKREAWRLIVAIADVSHYVDSNQALDQDALERGTSIYFPRRVIPMLPESLSNGLCSLKPDVDRLVLVCDMVIPAKGKQAGVITAYQFYNAVIHSHARTTYTQVWEALQQTKGPTARAIKPILLQIQHLYALYQLLIQTRKQRGAIDFDTVETRIICNDLGRIEQIVPYERNEAHKLIEECMLAANVSAADFMQRSKHPGLYRIHEGPVPARLELLREFLRMQGMSLGGGNSPSTSDYGELLNAARSRPDYHLIQTMCLRSMQQAMYSPDNVGHFGLVYSAYTHFTSPIRRYPDLLTHRVIKALLKQQHYCPVIPALKIVSESSDLDTEHSVWEKLGLMLSAVERRADDASRDVQAWLKCWYIKERVGEEFSGTVSGVTSFGIFVTLDALYVEGLVHISELGSEYFQFNEALHELRGERTGLRYRLTDKVQVQVSRVDLEARRIEFQLVTPTNFQTLKKVVARGLVEPPRRFKKAAAPKPDNLKVKTLPASKAKAIPTVSKKAKKAAPASLKKKTASKKKTRKAN